MRRGIRFLAAFLAVCISGTAWAHKGSDAYLDVQQTAQADYQFKLLVAVKDLDLVLPLDANADGKVTWGEIKAATPSVTALLNQAVNLQAAVCRLQWQFSQIEKRSDGAYLLFAAQTPCPAANGLTFNYTLFRDQDANHRLLVAGSLDGKDVLTTTSPQQSAGLVLLTASAVTTTESAKPAKVISGRFTALVEYFSLGVHHLLEGYDHLAFLLALVLPLRLKLGSRGSPTSSALKQDDQARNVWLDLLRTITAFTIGHSITLILATLGFTQGSPAWVEPVIALSIGVTALLNIRPVAWIRTDMLALAFGLVHGYGFAGLLLEAAAPTALLPWALAGFNLGVEAGQLLAVAGWVVLSQVVVNRDWYASAVVRGGSIVLMLLSGWWFWQRIS
jgi:HupE / UreJ protein